jgi:hypothetical protein
MWAVRTSRHRYYPLLNNAEAYGDSRALVSSGCGEHHACSARQENACHDAFSCNRQTRCGGANCGDRGAIQRLGLDRSMLQTRSAVWEFRARITASRCVPCLWTALASRKKWKLVRAGRGYLKSNTPASSSNGREETQRTRDGWNHCLGFDTKGTAGCPVCEQQALDPLPYSPLSNEIIYDSSVLPPVSQWWRLKWGRPSRKNTSSSTNRRLLISADLSRSLPAFRRGG